MTDPMPPPLDELVDRPRKPFAHHAALLAFWAPLLGLAIGLTLHLRQPAAPPPSTPFTHSTQTAALPILFLTLALNIPAILLAILALKKLPQYGNEKIRSRSRAAIVLSSLILLALGP